MSRGERRIYGSAVTQGHDAAPKEHALSARIAVGLEPLLALAGVDHVSLADDDGRLLSVRGGDPGPAGLVLGWGRDVRAVSRARERDLEDLMITSTSAYHLLRRVPVDGAEPTWVYVRVGRDEGNLALTRRRLAALTLHSGPAEQAPEAPAPVLPAPAAAAELLAGAVALPRRRPGALLPSDVRRAAAPPTPPARVASPVGLFEPATPAAVTRPAVTRPAVTRPPVARPPSAPAPRTVPSPAAGWATDLTVMRRLLAGLRRFV